MKKKILIIGESCKDIFVYCKADRLAPDLPIPVLSVGEQKENGGMAKNVEQNVKKIHDGCHIITNNNWENVTKTRYMHGESNHAFVRIDTDHNIDRVNVKDIPLDYDTIAISDYNKGFLLEEDIKYLCENHDNVFIDTKKILGEWAQNARYIKINNYEYERSKDLMPKALEDKIICTHGEKGATFRGKAYPVDTVEVGDSSGAGDTFFAALLVKYQETGDIEEAIQFANLCASKVVQQQGVTLL